MSDHPSQSWRGPPGSSAGSDGRTNGSGGGYVPRGGVPYSTGGSTGVPYNTGSSTGAPAPAYGGYGGYGQSNYNGGAGQYNQYYGGGYAQSNYSGHPGGYSAPQYHGGRGGGGAHYGGGQHYSGGSGGGYYGGQQQYHSNSGGGGYTHNTGSSSNTSSSSGLEGFTIKRKEKKKKGKKKKGKKNRSSEDTSKKFAKGAMMEMPMEEPKRPEKEESVSGSGVVAAAASDTTVEKTRETDVKPPEIPSENEETAPSKLAEETARKLKISKTNVAKKGGNEGASKTRQAPKETSSKATSDIAADKSALEARKALAAPKPEVKDDSDPREHLNVVFIGHVDAGKSTISGQVLLQTGMVDKRTIKKFEKEAKDLNRESWFLAFVMDTSAEERAKGKTVEVGRATFETKKRRFTVLDAPGHSNYVPNMIAGASQADVGVLVISARKGEFEAGFDRSGQTREHAMLAKTLGVTKLVVVVNKMDEPTVNWSKKRFDEIQTALKPFLRKFCGFKLRKDVHWVPMSGLTGENLKDKVDASVCPWNESEPLLTVLEKLHIEGRDEKKDLRVPILDKYGDRGVVAMGKVECGTLVKGQTITIQPTGLKSTIVSLWLDGPEEGKEVNIAKPGENVRVRLKGVDEKDMHKGYVLCDENTGFGVRYLDAKITFLALLPHRPVVTAGYKAMLHCHTVAEGVSVVKLLSKIVKGKKEKRPRFVKSHTVCTVRLKLDRKICVERFEDVAQLGVFTLRDEKETIAVGRVLKLLK